ncbi:GNAT family N-acetyltransferase [Paenibacillus lautus]|uniref:GNAT family N-acetyltransferase n=1 Tax=Paenibacillus lautus TaxID=1401 RepID=UPI003D2D6728
MIVTPRCKLIKLVSEDLHDVILIYKDPLVRRYLGGTTDDELLLKNKFEEVLSKSKMPGVYFWCVRLIKDDQFIGLVSLDRYHDGKNIELSYEFLPQHWGNGYATEVVRKLIDYSFTEIDLPKLVSETQTANILSCKLLERVGMKLENRLVRFGAEQAVYSIERT